MKNENFFTDTELDILKYAANKRSRKKMAKFILNNDYFREELKGRSVSDSLEIICFMEDYCKKNKTLFDKAHTFEDDVIMDQLELDYRNEVDKRWPKSSNSQFRNYH